MADFSSAQRSDHAAIAGCRRSVFGLPAPAARACVQCCIMPCSALLCQSRAAAARLGPASLCHPSLRALMRSMPATRPWLAVRLLSSSPVPRSSSNMFKALGSMGPSAPENPGPPRQLWEPGDGPAPKPPPRLQNYSDLSAKSIWRALIGNAAIAVLKYFMWMRTGSSAMLAEAVHTTVDCGNQALLMIGTLPLCAPAHALLIL